MKGLDGVPTSNAQKIKDTFWINLINIFVLPPDCGACELATAPEASVCFGLGKIRSECFDLGKIHQLNRAHMNPHVRLRETHGEVQRVQRVQRQRAAGSPHGNLAKLIGEP